MESICIEQSQANQQSLCILRLVGPDLHPTIKSYLRKKKSSFVARRIVSKLMIMGYISQDQWQVIYKQAARLDTCPALCQNLDAIMFKLLGRSLDKKAMKILDYWHYHLTL